MIDGCMPILMILAMQISHAGHSASFMIHIVGRVIHSDVYNRRRFVFLAALFIFIS